MSHYYAKFKENPCVGTDASTPFIETSLSSLIWYYIKDFYLAFQNCKHCVSILYTF